MKSLRELVKCPKPGVVLTLADAAQLLQQAGYKVDAVGLSNQCRVGRLEHSLVCKRIYTTVEDLEKFLSATSRPVRARAGKGQREARVLGEQG